MSSHNPHLSVPRIGASPIRRRWFSALASVLLTSTMLGMVPAAAATTIRVGIVGDEDVGVWKVVAEQAKKQGLIINTIDFSDYIVPNEALERGDIEANAFQHKPYLDNQIKTRGYHIVPVGNTAVWPIGLYSLKHKSVADLPNGALIGVPNDPSNEGRALLLLQGQGLITLKPGTGILATITDIAANPKNIQIKEFDAGIIGRSINQLDAAVINTDWAIKSKIDPVKDRIAQEPIKGNPYANFIAVRSADAHKPWVKVLVAAYQTEATKQALAKFYNGTAVPAW
jgi:D-methionine transport system substrate-binding protein